MNKRLLIPAFIVVFLLLTSVWIFNLFLKLPHPAVNQAEPAKTIANSNLQSTSNFSMSAQKQSPLEKAIPKEVLIKQVLTAENARSLDIYGKVVDQYGEPVVTAEIQGNVMLNVGFEHSKDEVYHTKTDTRGLFKFIGLHGVTLGIWPKKEGYTYDLKLPSKRPNDYEPNPSNPVVFTMWKLKGAEPMVHVEISTGIPCDGSPTNFDLLTGRKTDGTGDLVVKLTRNPVNIVRGTPFEWSISLEIVNGGLLEIADAYPNEAPAEGYKSCVTINVPTSEDVKDWKNSLQQSYYFKSQGGQNYGRLTINVTADFQPPPTYFGADIYLNPSGSRNLEFDPAKQINP